MEQKNQIAVFGEDVFGAPRRCSKNCVGVISVDAGLHRWHGSASDYDAVCAGETGHAEATRVKYDPAQISFNDLLTVFFATHDPTTLNRQGNDVGTQYRSAIFYSTPEQKTEAEKFIETLTASIPAGDRSSPKSSRLANSTRQRLPSAVFQEPSRCGILPDHHRTQGGEIAKNNCESIKRKSK